MHRLRQVYFWSVCALITVVAYVVVLLLIAASKLFIVKRLERATHRLASIWGQAVFRCVPGWKIEVRGKENLPQDKPVVMVANHQSMADIWAICFLPLQFRWLSKAEVFKVPLVGHGMRVAGYIPVKRGDKESHKEAMEESRKRLAQGVSMFFFPEGTRSETGDLRPFKIGAFRLAKEQGVGVLPIAITGTGGLLRKGSSMPQSAKVCISVLPEIQAKEGEDLDAFAARTREVIANELLIIRR